MLHLVALRDTDLSPDPVLSLKKKNVHLLLLDMT